MRKILPVFLLIILAILGQDLFARGGGKIVGQVFDAETGDPLAGCNIIIEGTLLGAATDEEGYFIILDVPAGTYDVSALMIGYVKDMRQGVKVVSTLTVKLDFSVKTQVLNSTEAITVEAYKVPLVQKDLTYTVQAVTNDEVGRLPITNLTDVVTQQAGITRNITTTSISSLPVFGQFATAPTDGLHFRGGRENETLYLIDGMNVTDGLWGGYNLDPISEHAVSSMETFTGTFMSRYGDAMSGVMNISTYNQIDLKPKFRVKAFTDNLGIDEASHNTYSYDLFASTAIPFINNLGLVVSHRMFSTDGYIFGYIYPEYINSESVDKSGNPEEVAMQYTDTQFTFAKLMWKPGSSFDFSLGGYYSKANQGLYNHYFKYNPYGTPQVNLEDKLLYGKFRLILNPQSYFSVNLSYYDRSFLSRLFENAELYEIRPQNGTAEFSTTGEDWVYFETGFKRKELSASYFSQLTHIHGLELGASYSQLSTNLARRNPDGFTALENYNYEPVEIQGYISDKMEFDEMGLIINIGLRMDYIDPSRKVLVDLRDLTNINAELKDAEPEVYFNPRLGISFPIMETAAMRFGFGRYYQYPDYFKVFQGTYLIEASQEYRPNPQLENTPIADTEIKPEKTVNYEVGIQTKLSQYVAFDITGFYRKTSNLIGVILNETNEGRRFQVMGNLDYATVKGIEFSLKKQFSNNFSASMNYTLSKTLVSTSVLFERPIDEALTFPANWDQPHSLNANLFFEFRNGFGFSIYGTVSSGYPYTRSQFDPNGERGPTLSTLDLNVFKNFEFLGFSQQFYVQVLNVFDHKNVWWVYADSGIPGDDASEATSHDYTNNPTMWGPGRRIQLGIKLWNQ